MIGGSRILAAIGLGFILTVVGFKVVVPDDPYADLSDTYLEKLKGDDDVANDAARKVRRFFFHLVGFSTPLASASRRSLVSSLLVHVCGGVGAPGRCRCRNIALFFGHCCAVQSQRLHQSMRTRCWRVDFLDELQTRSALKGVQRALRSVVTVAELHAILPGYVLTVCRSARKIAAGFTLFP